MAEKRVRTRIPAEFRAEGLSGRGEVRNVSAGGLFVGTLAIPEEGTPVEVKLTAPGRATVEVKGLVWWTAPAGKAVPCGFGLRLLDDDEGYKLLVESIR
jgi:uncharacterized protein (TIGR02266 family)